MAAYADLLDSGMFEAILEAAKKGTVSGLQKKMKILGKYLKVLAEAVRLNML